MHRWSLLGEPCQRRFNPMFPLCSGALVVDPGSQRVIFMHCVRSGALVKYVWSCNLGCVHSVRSWQVLGEPGREYIYGVYDLPCWILLPWSWYFGCPRV